MKFLGDLKILVAVLAVTLLSPVAFAGAGSHGGGGIKRNGEYLTFGSSKVQLRRAEVDQIPGLETLENEILKLDLDLTSKSKILASIMPGKCRHYYFVDKISDAENARLLKIYKELIKTQPDDTVVLYAVTDPLVGETYLLPDFLKLKEGAKQEHVLFHEGMWVLSPINGEHYDEMGHENPVPYVSYETVVKAEKAFGHYLEVKATGQDNYPVDLYRRLSEVSRLDMLLISALNYDVRKGNIKTERLTVSNSVYPKYSKLGELPKDFTVIQGNEILNMLANSQAMAWALAQSAKKPENALYKALLLQPSACTDNETVNSTDSDWNLGRVKNAHSYFIYDSEQQSVRTSGIIWRYPQYVNCLFTVTTP